MTTPTAHPNRDPLARDLGWPDDASIQTAIRVMGRSTVLAVSGGRLAHGADGSLILPVSHGYDVRVWLHRPTDTYTVARTFRRGGKVWTKRTWDGVYAENLGDTVYRASCFRDAPEGADA